MSDIHGRILWYELMTTDRDAAAVFYSEIVGWKTQAMTEIPGMDYTVWLNSKGEGIGGLMDLPEPARQMGAPPHWLAYIGVDDVDATVAQATELGAKIYAPPFDVETVGRIAIIADPQGAVFGVYRPASGQAPAKSPPVFGDVSWHELTTADAEAALTFYGELFGWRPTDAMEMGPGMTYQMFGREGDEGSIGGMMNLPPNAPMPPNWMMYFYVEGAADDAAERVKAGGGRILNGPMEIPGGDHAFQAMDVQGAAFAIHAK